MSFLDDLVLLSPFLIHRREIFFLSSWEEKNSPIHILAGNIGVPLFRYIKNYPETSQKKIYYPEIIPPWLHWRCLLLWVWLSPVQCAHVKSRNKGWKRPKHLWLQRTRKKRRDVHFVYTKPLMACLIHCNNHYSIIRFSITKNQRRWEKNIYLTLDVQTNFRVLWLIIKWHVINTLLAMCTTIVARFCLKNVAQRKLKLVNIREYTQCRTSWATPQNLFDTVNKGFRNFIYLL